jgi:hypothetical protein
MTYGTIAVDSISTSSGQILGAGNATGFKNRIINGDMRIDQRNAGAAQINVTSGAYVTDRFQFSTSQNSKWSLQQVTVSDLSGYTSSAYVTVSTTYTTGAADFALVDQKIEGFNVADLSWGTANAKTVTLSFWVKTNVTGTYGVTLLNSAANRGFNTTYTVTTSGVWQQVSITIIGDTSGTWLTNNGTGVWLRFGLGSGSNYAMPALNTWGSSFGYQPSGGAVISGNTGGYWQFTGVQLEVGSTATSFDVRDYGRELILCQRYYQVINGIWRDPNSAGTFFYWNGFYVLMRASPTMTVVSTSGPGSGFVWNNTNSTGSEATITSSAPGSYLFANSTANAEL